MGRLSTERRRQLQAQVNDLMKQLGAEPRTLEQWGSFLTQEQRDTFAARAMIQEWGDPVRALIRLGFKPELTEQGHIKDKEATLALAEQVFGTPGCQAKMAENTATIEENRDAMLQRLMSIAIHSDDTNAVRAASSLAKVMGLNKSDQNALPGGNTTNIFQMMHVSGGTHPSGTTRVLSDVPDAEEVIDATDFLTHEPQEGGVLIDDGEDPKELSA